MRSKDNPTDKGTRREATLKDISADSLWQNGFEWMKSKAVDFPTKIYQEIKHECEEASDNSNELIKEANIEAKSASPMSSTYLTTYTKNVKQRYEFANYLINSNKFAFKR